MEHCVSQSSVPSYNLDICRICHCEEDEAMPFIAPCFCAGSLRFVHQSCLQQWIKSSDTKCCELCKFNFIMHTKIKPFNKWEKLDMSGVERRKIACSVIFHIVSLTCVVYSIYVLIERTTEEARDGSVEWPFWTKLIVIAIGFTGGLAFMYIQCKMYAMLCRRWRAYNRVIYVQNAPEKVPLNDQDKELQLDPLLEPVCSDNGTKRTSAPNIGTRRDNQYDLEKATSCIAIITHSSSLNPSSTSLLSPVTSNTKSTTSTSTTITSGGASSSNNYCSYTPTTTTTTTTTITTNTSNPPGVVGTDSECCSSLPPHPSAIPPCHSTDFIFNSSQYSGPNSRLNTSSNRSFVGPRGTTGKVRSVEELPVQSAFRRNSNNGWLSASFSHGIKTSPGSSHDDQSQTLVQEPLLSMCEDRQDKQDMEVTIDGNIIHKPHASLQNPIESGDDLSDLEILNLDES